MKNGNYKSLGSVMWKIMKNPLAAELTYEECAEYTLEFLRLIGLPMIYENKLVVLELQQHKAELPCDLLFLEGVRYINTDSEGIVRNGIAMRESSNVYHLDPTEFAGEHNSTNYSNGEFTYKLQKGIIFTSMCDGCIQLSYEAIATDEDGYPLVPDNEKIMIAIEYYVLSRYLEPLYMMGKITDKAFEFIQQKRYFYTASAFNNIQMPSTDKMETMMNGLNRLIINTSAHQNFFKNFGVKERIKQHR